MKNINNPLSFCDAIENGFAKGICGDNVTWNIRNDTLFISGKGEMDNYISPWYGYRDHIRKVIIENGITNIGRYAFYHCEALEEIILPDSLRHIGEYAFYNCIALHDINFPRKLKLIETNSFKDCDAFKTAIKRAHFMNKLRLKRKYSS